MSTNIGVTWAPTAERLDYYDSVGVSADGTILVALPCPTSPIRSTDSGQSWTNIVLRLGCGDFVTSFANGVRWLASGPTVGGGGLYLSSDSGFSWQLAGTPVGPGYGSLGGSAEGSKLVVVVNGNLSFYSSTNSGLSWASNALPVAGQMLASADATILVNLGNGAMFTSTDFGTTWMKSDAPSNYWAGITLSADGHRIIVAMPIGSIYTLQLPTKPVLSFVSSDGKPVLSWIVPSRTFVLQQNPDLTTANWTDVSIPPTLNYTNLHYEVMIPATAMGSVSYRLAAR